MCWRIVLITHTMVSVTDTLNHKRRFGKSYSHSVEAPLKSGQEGKAPRMRVLQNQLSHSSMQMFYLNIPQMSDLFSINISLYCPSEVQYEFQNQKRKKKLSENNHLGFLV